jgi:hypothetical protein
LIEPDAGRGPRIYFFNPWQPEGRMTRHYDSQCEDLARYFLEYPTDETLVIELAGVIQQAIEDWEKNRNPPALSPPWTTK